MAVWLMETAQPSILGHCGSVRSEEILVGPVRPCKDTRKEPWLYPNDGGLFLKQLEFVKEP